MNAVFHSDGFEVSKFDIKETFEYYNRGQGQSFYEGIIVFWDEDNDNRILDFIDNLHDYERENIVAIQEAKGGIGVWQKSSKYSIFTEGSYIDGNLTGGDPWFIWAVVTLND